MSEEPLKEENENSELFSSVSLSVVEARAKVPVNLRAQFCQRWPTIMVFSPVNTYISLFYITFSCQSNDLF